MVYIYHFLSDVVYTVLFRVTEPIAYPSMYWVGGKKTPRTGFLGHSKLSKVLARTSRELFYSSLKRFILHVFTLLTTKEFRYSSKYFHFQLLGFCLSGGYLI